MDDDGDNIPDNEDASKTASLRAAKMASSKPPSQWAPDMLGELRVQMEDYRNRPDKTLMGAVQLGWLRKRTIASKSAGTRWQLIGQQLVVVDSSRADVDAAIAAKSKTDVNMSRLWASQLHNVTGWDCSTPQMCGNPTGHRRTYVSMDPAPYRSQVYKQSLEVTPSLVMSARAMYALTKYDVCNYFDAWEGYAAERTRFLQALENVEGSAVVYGGDSHNSWAGVHEKDGVTVYVAPIHPC